MKTKNKSLKKKTKTKNKSLKKKTKTKNKSLKKKTKTNSLKNKTKIKVNRLKQSVRATDKYERWYPAGGVISLISGIVLVILSMFCALLVTVVIMTQIPFFNEENMTSVTSMVISLMISVIGGITGFLCYNKYLQNKGFAFYNAIFLMSFAVLNFISSISVVSDIYVDFLLQTVMLIASTILTVIFAVSFIINGIYLLKTKDN